VCVCVLFLIGYLTTQTTQRRSCTFSETPPCGDSGSQHLLKTEPSSLLMMTKQSTSLHHDDVISKMFQTKNNNINIMFLNIIHRHVYISKHVSETGFCLRLQVEPTQLGPIDRTSPCLRTPAPTPVGVYNPSTAQTICES
jgi:hypothetical protein